MKRYKCIRTPGGGKISVRTTETEVDDGISIGPKSFCICQWENSIIPKENNPTAVTAEMKTKNNLEKFMFFEIVLARIYLQKF